MRKSSKPDRRDIPVPPHEKLELVQPSVTVLNFLIFWRDRNVPPIGLMVLLRYLQKPTFCSETCLPGCKWGIWARMSGEIGDYQYDQK